MRSRHNAMPAAAWLLLKSPVHTRASAKNGTDRYMFVSPARQIFYARNYLNYALRHRWITHNAAALVKKVKQLAPQDAFAEANVFAPEEIKALLQACAPEVRPIVMTAIYSD